jgi:hypothetical protein
MPLRSCPAPGCYRGGLVLSTTTMVEYTRYPWVLVYVCDTCGAPVVDCQAHPVPVDVTTNRRFMTTSRQLWKHHYNYHRDPVVPPAPGTEDVNPVWLAPNDAELPLPKLVLNPAIGTPPLQQCLLADFEDSTTSWRIARPSVVIVPSRLLWLRRCRHRGYPALGCVADYSCGYVAVPDHGPTGV